MNAIEKLLEKYYDTLGAIKQICLALDNTKKALYCDEERETVAQALALSRANPTPADEPDCADEPAEFVKFEVITSRCGVCIAIDGYRVAGSKPLGGGTVERSMRGKRSDIMKALERK